MEFKIEHEHGHYVMYVDGVFYGSYDTISEAVQDIEELRREKQEAV